MTITNMTTKRERWALGWGYTGNGKLHLRSDADPSRAACERADVDNGFGSDLNPNVMPWATRVCRVCAKKAAQP